jgi:flagellar protein FlaJ
MKKGNTFTIASKRTVEELGVFDRVALLLFGSFFRKRSGMFSDFQRTLRQARIDDGYDLYLSRTLLWFICLSALSLVLAVFSTGLLFGFIPTFGISSALGIGVPEQIDAQLSSIGVIPTAGFASMVSLFLLAGIPVVLLYILPWYKAGEREREIDTMLPYTVTFMYALSRGGANIVGVLKTVSESDDIYGESANEFKMIVRDIEFFDSDLRGAFRDASQTSPSNNFSDFVDDLISVIDTGGNMESFLYDKTEEFLEESRRKQENFLETLSLMGEIYVTVFVAGPLFVIIIITIMALIGGGTINLLYIVVYALLPLGNLGFAFLIDVLKSGKSARSTVERPGYEMSLTDLDGFDDPRIKKLQKIKRRGQIKETVLNPVKTFRENPKLTLLITFPLALAYIGVLYSVYGIPVESLVENSVELTVLYFVVPLLTCIFPLSIFHEMRMRRKSKILTRIPSMLKKLSSANSTGMSLEESFGVVSKSTAGLMGDELKHVKNDIDWRGDLNEALIRFAKRVNTPRLSRTVKLITKAARSTGNITEVIDIAAKDVMQTHRLEKDRRQEMSMYTVIIIVSFLVYLLVVVMLNEAFLSEIAKVSSNQADSAAASQRGTGGAGGFNLSNLPVGLYNMVFYHSTLIQAFGAGLIAGQMGREDMMSGLKFSIAMIVVATGVFVII